MVDEMDDKLLLVAFHNGVNFDLFIHKLYEQEPQIMNAEDTIIAKKRKRAKRMEADLPCHPKQGPCPKKARTVEKKDRENKKASSTAWTSAYANQGWSILEVAGKNERRFQQA